MALNGVVGAVVFDPTANVYYWFFAGLLMLVVRLDREAVAAAVPAVEAAETVALPLAGVAAGRPVRRWQP
jgi:hypothetical protein